MIASRRVGRQAGGCLVARFASDRSWPAGGCISASTPRAHVCSSATSDQGLRELAVGSATILSHFSFIPSPQFRNEGIDLTHNPEFTTCEFYQVRFCGS